MRKKIILELIVGIFGWVWIIASVASLYFFVIAIFANGEWSSFLWALGISAVAKWLTKSFQDNQQRVVFETQLIDQGYTREQAGKEWLSRYMK